MRTRPYSLAVIAFDEMDLLDVAGPLEVFSTAGRKWNWRAVKATLVASEPRTFATRAQLSIGPALPFDACPTPELVLIPGGYGARRALEDAGLLAYLTRARTQGVLTLSVGLGSLLAAAAGLLHECEVASSAALAPELSSLDASITPRVDVPLTSAVRTIAAAQAGSALELGLETVARLLGRSQALGAARELGYAWGVETLPVDIVRG